MGVSVNLDVGRVVLASGNRHKVEELQAMLSQADLGIAVVGMTVFGDPPHVVEDADDFAGNAALKAEAIAAWIRPHVHDARTWVLADDSGLSVAALDDRPGVHSARFAGESASDADNNAKLVALMQARGLDCSPGHYSCVLALTRVDPRVAEPGVLLFTGQWDVNVRVEARGTGGFGYDPHCWLDGDARTVAELERDEKARLSHRGQAMTKLIRWLAESRRLSTAALDPPG